MSWRVISGTSLIAAVGLLSVGKQLFDALGLDARFRYGDMVAEYDQRRFEQLKPSLPTHGVVGYVEDDHQQADATALYHLTQFVLVPVVVDRSTDRPLVVGNERDGIRLYENTSQLREAGQ